MNSFNVLIDVYYKVICINGLYEDVDGKLNAAVSVAQLIAKMF